MPNDCSKFCINFREISLLNIEYTVLKRTLCKRLNPTVNKLIGPYKSDFRAGKLSMKKGLPHAISQSAFGAKLRQLCKLTLGYTKKSVKIGKHLSESFDTN